MNAQGALPDGAGSSPLLETLTPGHAGWAGFEALYAALFPAAEREPLARMRTRCAAARYGVTGALADGDTVGFTVVDNVADPPHAVLTFVGVARAWQGRGLGAQLVRAAVAEHCGDGPLLVEAVPRVAGLYARAGFRALALEYRVPRFDGAGSAPLRLMVCGSRRALDGAWLRAVIGHMFVDGYGVAATDTRLRAQQARVGAVVEVERC